MKKTILLIILSFLIINSVNAIQIAKPRNLHDTVFEPYKVIEFSYFVRNNRDFKLYALPQMSGDLQEYTSFASEKILLKPNEVGEVWVKIQLPATLPPGKHKMYFGATEALEEGAGIAVKTTARFRIEIRGRHPGKYVVSKLSSRTIVENTTKEVFVLSAQNLGEQDINAMFATIDIYDAEENAVGMIKTESVPLVHDQKYYFEEEMDTGDLKKGVYEARGTVNFDGQHVFTNNVTFRIGEKVVLVEDYPKKGEAEKLQKFPIKIRSEWNDQIKDLYAVVLLKNETSILSNTQTPTINIESFGQATLDGFIDLTGVDIGEYDLEINLHYDNKVTKLYDKYQVVSELEEEKTTSINTAVLVTNILLILIVIFLIANLFKFKKK